MAGLSEEDSPGPLDNYKAQLSHRDHRQLLALDQQPRQWSPEPQRLLQPPSAYPEHLGHDAFDSLEEESGDEVHRDAINSDILVLETNGQVRVEHDDVIDTYKITDAIEANLGLIVEFEF